MGEGVLLQGLEVLWCGWGVGSMAAKGATWSTSPLFFWPLPARSDLQSSRDPLSLEVGGWVRWRGVVVALFCWPWWRVSGWVMVGWLCRKQRMGRKPTDRPPHPHASFLPSTTQPPCSLFPCVPRGLHSLLRVALPISTPPPPTAFSLVMLGGCGGVCGGGANGHVPHSPPPSQ